MSFEQCCLCFKWLPKEEIKQHQSQCSTQFSKQDQEAYDERMAMFYDQNQSTIFQTKKNPVQVEPLQPKAERVSKIIIREVNNQFIDSGVQQKMENLNLQREVSDNNEQIIQRPEQLKIIKQNEEQLKSLIRQNIHHSNSPIKNEQILQEQAPLQHNRLMLSREFMQPQQIQKHDYLLQSEMRLKQNQKERPSLNYQPHSYLKPKVQVVEAAEADIRQEEEEKKLPQIQYENDQFIETKQSQRKEKQQSNNVFQYRQTNDFQQLKRNYLQSQMQDQRNQQPRQQREKAQQKQQSESVNNEITNNPQPAFQIQAQPNNRNSYTSNQQRRQYIPNHLRHHHEERKRNLSDHQKPAPFIYKPGMKLTDAQVNKLTPEQLYEYFTGLDLENQVGYQSRIFNLQNKAVQIQKTEICSICFEEIQPQKEKQDVKLDCNHCFHYACIEQWLKIQKNCPVCKVDVVL